MNRVTTVLIVISILMANSAHTQKNTIMKPFKIKVSDSTLNDLKTRLELTRWPDEPENACWMHGSDPVFMRELIEYWKDQYNWRLHEEELNKYPQFITEINGIKIHFIHVKSKVDGSEPLLLTHGWPDSFYRYHKVIDQLTNNPDGLSYDVIVPSIPGFGFSDRVALNDDQTAEICYKLMTGVLEYDTFFAAGGDMGTGITKSLAVQYPETLRAIHLTDVGYPDGSEDWSIMMPEEQEFGTFIRNWWYAEGAYNMMHSTKPQTVAYGLNDSPAGLAAWIIEKFNSWSDNQGNIGNVFTKDELITNIMIYWVTQSINTSMRTYKMNAMAAYSTGLRSSEYVEVPTGVASFPGEAPAPIEWAKRKTNCVRFTKMEKGGHFAALEVPDLWVSEIRQFFGSFQ